MLKNDSLDFKPWEDKYKNKFLTVQEIAKSARRFAESTDNVVSHCEALTWTLRHEIPDSLKDRKDYYLNRSQWLRDHIDKVLGLVEDEFVKKSAIESFYTSLQKKKLTYVYINVIEEPRRARIRVLVNQLWYTLNTKEDI